MAVCQNILPPLPNEKKETLLRSRRKKKLTINSSTSGVEGWGGPKHHRNTNTLS